MMIPHLPTTYSRDNSRSFVESLAEEARSHRVLRHPYLQALADGSLPNATAALKDFCFQYLCYSEGFLRYLTATVSLIDARGHRDSITHNMMEESGVVPQEEEEELRNIGIDPDWVRGVPHPELFVRFLEAAGMDKAWRLTHSYCDEAVIWSSLFLQCCSAGGPAQAIGAIGLGTEDIVKYVYRPIISAIDKNLDISRRDRVFFDLHAALDDEHGETLQQIAADYARYRRHRAALRTGMLMALNLRCAFFDAMMVRAREVPLYEEAAA